MAGSGMHSGHRERVRAQILAHGTENMPEHNILEFLLFYCIPRADTNELAHILIDKFGSIAGVLDASPDELMKTPGIGNAAAALLCSLTGVWRSYQSAKTRPGTVLDSSEKIMNYLRARFAGRSVETLYLVCLDLKYRVISCRVMATGCVDRVSFPIRLIVEAALSQHAVSVIIGHNHPSGFALPSSGDRGATELLRAALSPLGIELFDHVVLCEDDGVSFRDSGWFSLCAK